MKTPKGSNSRPGTAFWLVLIVISGTTVWQKASAPPKPVTDERKIGLITQELQNHVGRELEFVPSHSKVLTLLSRSIDLGGYLISNGPVLADGDTVGIPETERIRVKHAVVQSTQTPVYRLTFETAEGA